MADTTFADAFIQGMEMRKRRDRQRMLDEDDRRQREVGNQITARNLALQDIDLAAKLPAQQEQLPEGVMGPPKTIEQLINVPGVPSLGVPGRAVKPLTMTDLLAQRRADEDVKQASALDMFKQEQAVRDESAIKLAGERDKLESIDVTPDSPLVKFGLKPGQYKPQAISAFTALQNAEANRSAETARRTEAALARKDIQGAMAAQRDYQRSSGLADNYRSEKAYKDYATIAPQYAIVRDAAKDPSAAGDLSLIFSYMKILDPGSTVREGEFANAQNSGSVPEKVLAQYNKIVSGERLTATQRADFTTSAKRAFDSYRKQKTVIDDVYRKRAERTKVNPEDVLVPDFVNDDEGEAASASAEPLIVEGYKLRVK